MNATANRFSKQKQYMPFSRQLRIATLALSVSLGLGLTAPAQALPHNVNPPNLLKNAPHVYVVKKGDTLWDIAGHFLKKPWRWPEIWAGNKHVKNPHWIYPGDRLLLCFIDGRHIVGKDEGDGCAGIARRMHANNPLPVVHLSPRVREEPLTAAVPLIPLHNIEHWLHHTLVLSAEQVTAAPYVVADQDNRVIAAAGQSVYVRGKGLSVDQTYGVYHETATYPTRQGKTLSHEMTEVATGTVTAIHDDIATIALQKSFDSEVNLEDRVLPVDDTILPDTFYPVEPDQVTPGGQVLRITDSISAAAKGSVIVLDRGTADAVAPGQVFAIYQKGNQIRDPKNGDKIQLPSEHIATAMIFRSFDRVSYAYVLESDLPIHVADEIRPPMDDDQEDQP